MRRNNTRPALSIVTVLLFTSMLHAQDIEPRESNFVRIESEPRGAEVYRGDTLLGSTPLRLLRAEAHDLVLYFPGRLVWNAQRAELGNDLLREHLGVTQVRFARMLQLRSLPYGAAVYRGDSLLGTTPLYITADTAMLTLHMVGYESVEVSPMDFDEDAVLLTLEALAPPGTPDFSVSTDGMRFPRADILLPAGLSIAAGIAAVMLKQHADARYDEYIANRDEALLSEAKKYDIYAGLSLAVLQLGLGYFILRLFEE